MRVDALFRRINLNVVACLWIDMYTVRSKKIKKELVITELIIKKDVEKVWGPFRHIYVSVYT